MKLTAKQEKFCQLVANGSNQYEAYLEAYPKSKNWKRETVDNNAYKLSCNSEILTRINELKAKIEAKVIEGFAKTKDDILIELEGVKNNSAEPRIKIDCLKEQGKLLGYYEDTVNMKGQFNILEGLRKFKERGNKPEEE